MTPTRALATWTMKSPPQPPSRAGNGRGSWPEKQQQTGSLTRPISRRARPLSTFQSQRLQAGVQKRGGASFAAGSSSSVPSLWQRASRERRFGPAGVEGEAAGTHSSLLGGVDSKGLLLIPQCREEEEEENQFSRGSSSREF